MKKEAKLDTVDKVLSYVDKFKDTHDCFYLGEIIKICKPIEMSYKRQLPQYLQDDFESIYLEHLWHGIEKYFNKNKGHFFTFVKSIAYQSYCLTLKMHSKLTNRMFFIEAFRLDTTIQNCDDNIYLQDILLKEDDFVDYVISSIDDRFENVYKNVHFTKIEKKILKNAKYYVKEIRQGKGYINFRLDIDGLAKHLGYDKPTTVSNYIHRIKKKIAAKGVKKDA